MRSGVPVIPRYRLMRLSGRAAGQLVFNDCYAQMIFTEGVTDGVLVLPFNEHTHVVVREGELGPFTLVEYRMQLTDNPAGRHGFYDYRHQCKMPVRLVESDWGMVLEWTIKSTKPFWIDYPAPDVLRGQVSPAGLKLPQLVC